MSFHLSTDSKRALQPEGMEGVEGYIANALACNCPNDCEETLYFQEMSESFVKKKSEFFRYLKNSPDNIVGRLVEEAKNMTFPQQKKRLYQRIEDIETTGSIVHVYFKELGIVKYSRDQVYSAMDVIGKVFVRTLPKRKNFMNPIFQLLLEE